MKTLIKLIALCAIFSISFHVSAWNARGHMIVASIAYNNLNDSLKIAYTDIFKFHPFYDTWATEYKGIKDVEFGEFLFMKASTWPDDIRNTGNPNDHPEWHYITYTISFPNGHKKVAESDTNVVTSMQKCLDSIGDEHTGKAVKAIYLAWLIHLVGDVHQPLHCGSLFNVTYPNGDRGGNSVYVKVKASNKAVKLHSYWDGLLGTSENYKTTRNEARTLESTYKPAAFNNLNNLSLKEWSFESFDLAISVAYKNGDIAKLEGIKSKDTAPLIPSADTYVKTATETGEKRVTLAGYRLAKILDI